MINHQSTSNDQAVTPKKMMCCDICLLDYDTSALKPMVGTCGHTICLACSSKMNGKCPTCRRDSFATPATNFAILEQVEAAAAATNSNGNCNCDEKIQKINKKFEKTLKEMKEESELQEQKKDIDRVAAIVLLQQTFTLQMSEMEKMVEAKMLAMAGDYSRKIEEVKDEFLGKVAFLEGFSSKLEEVQEETENKIQGLEEKVDLLEELHDHQSRVNEQNLVSINANVERMRKQGTSNSFVPNRSITTGTVRNGGNYQNANNVTTQRQHSDDTTHPAEIPIKNDDRDLNEESRTTLKKKKSLDMPLTEKATKVEVEEEQQPGTSRDTTTEGYDRDPLYCPQCKVLLSRKRQLNNVRIWCSTCHCWNIT